MGWVFSEDRFDGHQFKAEISKVYRYLIVFFLLSLAPHFNWNDSGLFEYDIRLHPRTRGVVFGGVKPNVQYSKTKFKNSLWPNGVIHYTYDNTISKFKEFFHPLELFFVQLY